MLPIKPRISVCIATFNGEKFIRQQLESILTQLSDDDEVIISDNCSTDSTVSIINSIKDRRIFCFSFDIKGVVFNFENSLIKSRGDIIIISDQDDIWLEGKVTRICQELEFFDLVVTNCKVVDENLNIIHESLFNLIRPGIGIIKNLVRNSYTGCCMAFNKKIYHAILPFPCDLPMHDWWIGLSAEIIGSVKFINDPYILYRRHGLNASTLSTPSELSFRKKISLRVVMLKNLIFRFVLKSK